MLSLNRIVVLLTPVFGGVAAVLLAWAARHFPGLPLPSKGELTALEVAAFTGAVGMAAHWLNGHQKYEKYLQEIEKDVLWAGNNLQVNGVAPPPVSAQPIPPATLTTTP